MTITKNSDKRILPKTALYVLLCLFVFCVWSGFVNQTDNQALVKATALMAIYALYVFLWIKQTKTFKSLFLYYLLYTAFTNAGQLFLLVFDIDVLNYINVLDNLSDTLLCKTLDYQMSCTVLMSTFALIAHEIHSITKEQKQQFLEKTNRHDKRLSISDLLYVFMGLWFFLANLVRLASRANMSYGEAFNSGESSTVPFLVAFIFYITMYIACFTHREKGDRFKIVIWTINTLVGGTSLLYGSRNVIIPLVFGMIFVFKFDYKKMPLRKKLIVFAIGLFGAYLLGSFTNLRQMSLSEITTETLVDALFGEGLYNQLIMFISEMGGSLRVLTTTIDAIDLGSVEGEQTFLYTVLKGLIPQVEWLDAIGVHEPERWRLSAWITDTYGQNAGWGYSMYAEAYYNFKEWGCVFMGVFGYVYALLECKMEKWFTKGYTVVASAWLFLATYLIFVARADSLLITTRLRYIVYLSIVCVLFRKRVNMPTIKIKGWQRKSFKQE